MLDLAQLYFIKCDHILKRVYLRFKSGFEHFKPFFHLFILMQCFA